MNAVRISGLGIVSAYGAGIARLVDGMRRGEPALAPLAAFPSPVSPDVLVSEVDRTPYGRDEAGSLAMALAAIREGLAEAGIGAATGLKDWALVCGGSNAATIAEERYRTLLVEQPGARPIVPDPGYLADRLAAQLGIEGPVLTINTACSSSANAMLVARDLVARGCVARSLVLGIEGLSSVALSGFQSLLLLDADGCHPFDAQRRGLQLGEGMAALVLERADTATRGFRLLGGANLCDIHHVTSANPDGSGMVRCMQQALADADIGVGDVASVKAHGTGSAENDAAEVAAMRHVFGAALPPFTALKRYIGHTLGACGAMETVSLLGCLRAGFLPAAAGFREADAELNARPLTTPMAPPRGAHLLSFFGFGGNYASLVIADD
jgi:3-oxoacyl-[acyl-carrier-protein] synthase I